jgi:hypothetical protein
VLIAELAITAYEALFYWGVLRERISLGKALLVSGSANVTSCVIGLLLPTI